MRGSRIPEVREELKIRERREEMEWVVFMSILDIMESGLGDKVIGS